MANISNSTNNTLIDGSTGADFIENTGWSVTIFAYKGDDTISNGGNYAYIDAGKGNDSIYVSISSYYDYGRQTVYGGDGDDTIASYSGGSSSIDGGAGNDVISIRSGSNTITGGDGNDSIYSSGSSNSISSGAGNDYIDISSNASLNTVNAGAGNDTINLHSMNNLIQYSGGADVIDGFNMTDTLHIVDGSVTSAYYTEDDNVIINVSGGGKITILEGAEKRLNLKIGSGALLTTIISEAGEDTGSGGGSDTGSGGDTTPSNVINGTSGADSLVARDDNVTVYALAGDDTVEISGNHGYYDGGADDDRLSLDGGAEGNTLTGGAGNDTLYTNGLGNVILYSGGKDVIVGFGESDSLVIDGSVTKTAQSGANVLVTVGSAANVITIRDVALGNVSVDGGVITYTDEVIDEPEPDYPVSLTASADKASYSDEGATVYALGGNDTIENAGGESYIDGGAGNDLLINTASNVTLEGGAGSDRLSLSADAGGNVLIGGAGNDSIFTNGAGNVIRYSAGGGKDAVIGFAGDDSIEIDGSITKIAQSGANVLVTVGSSANVITIRNTALGNIDTTGGVITYTEEALPDYPLSLTSGADSLVVSDDEAEVYALAGNDTLKISGNYGYYDGGAGNDKLSLDGGAEGNTLAGGAGADTIYTNGLGNVIQYSTGGGKDVIVGFGESDSIAIDGSITKIAQSGANVVVTVGSSANVITIKDFALGNVDTTDGVITYTEEILPDYPMSLTSGKDSLVVSDDEAEVYALAGNDSLTITGSDGYFDGGAGNDRFSLGADAVNNTIYGGAGNDTIYLNGGGNIIQYSTGGGKDVIVGFGENDSIEIDGSITKIAQSGANVVVTVGSSANVITIKNFALGNVDTTGGVITYTEEILPEYPMSLTSGKDSLMVSDDEAEVYALAGNDSLTITGNDGYFDGGAGNDRFSLGSDATGNTIYGGAGVDTIYMNGAGNVIQYSTGDGKDVIYGFGESDSIELDAEVTRIMQSGVNVLVTVGSSANVLTFKNFSTKNLYVEDNIITYTEEILPEYPLSLTSGADSLTFSDGGATVYALGGNDTITNQGDLSYISGGANNDVLINGGSEVTLAGDAGADMIYTNGMSNLILYATGGGKDTIIGFSDTDSIQITSGAVRTSVQSGANVIVYVGTGTSNSITLKDTSLNNLSLDGNVITFREGAIPITLTAKNDTYSNADDEATIDALAGNDVLSNSGSYVSISGGTGNDSIMNTGNLVTLDGGTGNDTIVTNGDTALINAGAGTDKISLGNDAGNVTLAGGAGNDTIYSNGNSNLIQFGSGDGKDIVFGFSGEDSIQITSGSVSRSVQSGANVLVTVGSSSNVLTIRDAQISKLTVEDNIISAFDMTKYLTERADTTLIADSNIYVDALAGADRITLTGSEVTISGGAGNDTVIVDGSYALIDGGAGADRISLGENAANVTVNGGADNDSIYSGGGSNLFLYAAGDGNDTIMGFTRGDSIKVSGGSVSGPTWSGVNATFQIGSGKIVLRNVADEEFKVSNGVITLNEDAVIIKGMATADTISNTVTGARIDALAGNDKIYNSGNEVSIYGGAGNDLISLSAGSEYNTIIGGAGADTIYTNGNGNLISYAAGEGKDVIFGFGGADSVEVTGGVTRMIQSGANVLATIGGSSANVLTFKNTALAELIAEDNFIYSGRSGSNGARIDDICAEKFAVTEFETAYFETIAQSNYISIAAADDK